MKTGYKVCGTRLNCITRDFKDNKKAAYEYANRLHAEHPEDTVIIRFYRWVRDRGEWVTYTFHQDFIWSTI